MGFCTEVSKCYLFATCKYNVQDKYELTMYTYNKSRVCRQRYECNSQWRERGWHNGSQS